MPPWPTGEDLVLGSFAVVSTLPGGLSVLDGFAALSTCCASRLLMSIVRT